MSESKPIEDRRPILPLLLALLLIIAAIIIFALSLGDSKPKKTSPQPQAETPVKTVQAKPAEVDKVKREVKAGALTFRLPEGTKLMRSSIEPGQDYLYMANAKANRSFLILTSVAQADEPVEDRAYFARLGSNVQPVSFQGTRAYFITTRYKNGFVRLTLLAQAYNRNYTVAAFGRTRDISQLKRDLKEMIASIKPAK